MLPNNKFRISIQDFKVCHSPTFIIFKISRLGPFSTLKNWVLTGKMIFKLRINHFGLMKVQSTLLMLCNYKMKGFLLGNTLSALSMSLNISSLSSLKLMKNFMRTQQNLQIMREWEERSKINLTITGRLLRITVRSLKTLTHNLLSKDQQDTFLSSMAMVVISIKDLMKWKRKKKKREEMMITFRF
jgi:hypothetical protein